MPRWTCDRCSAYIDVPAPGDADYPPPGPIAERWNEWVITPLGAEHHCDGTGRPAVPARYELTPAELDRLRASVQTQLSVLPPGQVFTAPDTAPLLTAGAMTANEVRAASGLARADAGFASAAYAIARQGRGDTAFQFTLGQWPNNVFRCSDPVVLLLAAMALPSPAETDDDPDHWHEPLCQARERGDPLQWGVFADWCLEKGFTRWEKIARAEYVRLGGKTE